MCGDSEKKNLTSFKYVRSPVYCSEIETLGKEFQ